MATNDNEIILARLRGVPPNPATPESDADPRNPNALRVGRSLSDVLKLLYDHEINVAMSSFWDGGWLVQIGDESNGFRSSQNFRDEDFGAIPDWLWTEAQRVCRVTFEK